MVMKDETCSPPQQDPLHIISAWAAWNDVRPLTLTDRKSLSPEEAKLKDTVDKRFITYMSILRCTNILPMPVRVFCHMACKNGCPPQFRGFNDRGFREGNMNDVLRILRGEGPKPWNNIHNSSMHMMLKWTDQELKEILCLDMSFEDFNQLTPKQIGDRLTDWFNSLDNENLSSRTDLVESIIPEAGQHRFGGIPRWKDEQDSTSAWQAVLGTHIQMNFWLRLEQPIANYLSGVRKFISK
jgi:hypothetical protein